MKRSIKLYLNKTKRKYTSGNDLELEIIPTGWKIYNRLFKLIQYIFGLKTWRIGTKDGINCMMIASFWEICTIVRVEVILVKPKTCLFGNFWDTLEEIFKTCIQICRCYHISRFLVTLSTICNVLKLSYQRVSFLKFVEVVWKL